MWKDTDFYSKRDDDSAIGDSEQNSAEEESMNSRRKSSISDDIDEMNIDPHAQLASKLGTKIPECLLKSSEETLENCKRIKKTVRVNKPKRQITVLPNAAAVTSQRPPRKSSGSIKDENSVLEAKLQYLLNEMKKLREIDQEILQKFVNINESVEEVRWKLTEDEENFKKKIEEEEAEEDLISTLTIETRSVDIHSTNYDVIGSMTQLNTSDYESAKSSTENTDISRSVTLTAATTTLSSCERVQSTNNHDLSLVDTRAIGARMIHNSAQQQQQQQDWTSKKIVQEPDKDDLNCTPASDVWIKREDYLASFAQETSFHNSSNVLPMSSKRKFSQQPPKLSFEVKRRTSEVVRPSGRSRSNLGACSFRMVNDENSRIGHLARWSMAENKEDKLGTRMQSLEQRHAVNISPFRGPNGLQGGITKPSDSSSSLNSSSSQTSSESSSPATPPVQNPAKRSSSSKWGRFLLRRTSKSNSSGDKKANGLLINNNYKPSTVAAKHISEPVIKSSSIVSMPHKHTPSNATRWTHHQDDVTYL